jgi:hypothetical protein
LWQLRTVGLLISRELTSAHFGEIADQIFNNVDNNMLIAVVNFLATKLGTAANHPTAGNLKNQSYQ